MNEKVCPGVRSPDAHLPSAVGDVPLVVVWIEGPLFVHITVLPTLTVTVCGEKEKSAIATFVTCAAVVVAAVVAAVVVATLVVAVVAAAVVVTAVVVAGPVVVANVVVVDTVVVGPVVTTVVVTDVVPAVVDIVVETEGVLLLPLHPPNANTTIASIMTIL